ncbi:MAG: PucR family transcriptional regulator [Egibacteraceae bacterium]
MLGGIGRAVDKESSTTEGRRAAKLTVADVLELDALADAEVVAGRAGLSRVVTGVNIIEVPDVWQWLHGGEFLLSAAYPWRDDPERLVQLLTKLDETGIAAIGFKLGRYVEALPRQVLDTADSLGVPIILLPATVAYRDVFEPLYGRLLSRPAAEQEPTRQIDQALLRFGLDDQSIEKVAGALAEQVDKPVRVVDLLDDVVYSAPPDGVVLKRGFDRLDKDTRALVDALGEHHLRRRVARIDDVGKPALAAALVVGRRRHGYILVLDSDPDDETKLEAAVSHAAELVSFLLLKRLAFLEGRRQASSLFFESLMSDSLTNEEATERALTLGLRLSRPCTVLIVGFLAGGTELPTDEWNVLHHHLERGLEPAPRVVTADLQGRRLHAMVQTPQDETEPLLRSAVDCLAGHVALGIGARTVVAAGSPGLGLEGVRRSHSEALIAFETAQRLGRQGVTQFTDLGVERLLSQIPLTSLSRSYVESLLGGITDDDELLRTLELYLQHGGNKSATAAAVPLHRSSLLYRLQKISRRLGANLDDPDQCHELWLALRLRRVLHRSQ